MSNTLHPGRAEQVSAEARMADRAVADDIDERSSARHQRSFERGTEFFRPLDVLPVTIHELEHAVVALVRLDLERISPAFEERHFFKARPPGTVVPQHHDDRQPVPAGSFEIEAADAETTVADNEH